MNLFKWPNRVLGPPPGLKEINLAAWAIFTTLLVVPIVFGFWVQNKKSPGTLPRMTADFTYIYGVGRIANQYPSDRLYDYSLQQKVFEEISPKENVLFGPSPYPPYVALFFSLFARLPYGLAYFAWTLTSLALYIIGISAAGIEVFPDERLKTTLLVCFALAFYPFCFSTLLNGRIATLEVFSVGLAVYEERHAKPFRSGLALSILAYKPTLLLLLFPMLVLTRRFRALSGFISGTAILIAIATAFEGFAVWPRYVHFLVSFGKLAGLNGHTLLDVSRYIDFNSFSYMIRGGRSVAGLTILFVALASVAAALATLLWRSAGFDRPVQYLAWASALTWTLLLNVYVPLYDSILVTVAIILTLGALRDLKWRKATEWIGLLSVLIYGLSWETVVLTRRFGIPILSVLLAVLGFAQLFFLHRAIRLGLTQRTSELSVK